jgi:hypothetical protein
LLLLSPKRSKIKNLVLLALLSLCLLLCYFGLKIISVPDGITTPDDTFIFLSSIAIVLYSEIKTDAPLGKIARVHSHKKKRL